MINAFRQRRAAAEFFYMSRMKRDISLWVYIVAIAIIVVWGCTFVQTKILINAG